MIVYDWLAKQISDAMITSFNKNDGTIQGIGTVRRPEETKRVMKVKIFNQWYKITVEDDDL